MIFVYRSLCLPNFECASRSFLPGAFSEHCEISRRFVDSSIDCSPSRERLIVLRVSYDCVGSVVGGGTIVYLYRSSLVSG